LKQEIKNNICLIDFPGHNTNNNLFFEKEVYQNVLKMSTFFIYMNNGKAFKEDSNKLLLSKLFKEVISIRIGDISPKEFIDSCLFIFNKADILEKEEKNLDGIQNEVKQILDLPKEFDSDISCSLFSSKIYKNFIKESYKYKIENLNSLLEKYYKKFKHINNDNFLNYFYKNLYKMIKSEINDFSYDDKNEAISSDIFIKISEKMENFYSEKFLDKDINYNNNILKISKLLIYYYENIKHSNYFKESNANETFNKMNQNIIKSSNLKRNEYINQLERCFFYLNILFRIENSFINVSAKESLNSALTNIKNNIKDILQLFQYEKIINHYKNLILEFLDIQQKNFKKLMKEYNNDLEKILEFINSQINNLFKELDNTLEEILENVEKKILKEMEKIGLSINSTNVKNKINLIKNILLSNLVISIFKIMLFINPITILFTNNKNKFNIMLKILKDKINNTMKNYFSYYNDKMQKYEYFINDSINKFLELIKASNIQEDDNYNEVKENYLEIFEDYKKMNIIFDIKKP